MAGGGGARVHVGGDPVDGACDLMRAVVQRVSRAQVTVDGEIVGEIGLGLLVLLGQFRSYWLAG